MNTRQAEANTSEASSSRTLTVDHAPASHTQPHDVGILRLRPEPRSRPGLDGQSSSSASGSTRRVVWTEETVDNEGLGRKKSKSKSRSSGPTSVRALTSWCFSLLYLPQAKGIRRVVRRVLVCFRLFRK